MAARLAPTLDRRARIGRMLRPRSAVFVGGRSVIPAIEYCRTIGFEGGLHVIHPHRTELTGLPCVRSAHDLPAAPDLAFVAVPREAAPGAILNLAAAGAGAAILNTAGFAETDPAGAGRQRLLMEAAGEMPILGPNCPGLANFLDASAFMMDHLGVHRPRRGVAIISNGGAYLADLSSSDRSLPLAYLIGAGNQASITVADLLDVVLDDDRVAAVNLYFESVRDVAALSRSGAKALRKGIPVVALKAGRTASGTLAARSHTASIAGDAAIASAVFDRLGFIEVRTATEAMETLKMLAFGGAPQGPRVAVATSSGTYATLGADMAETLGLSLPQPSAAARTELESHLEDFLTPGNPLDIATGQFWDDDRQRACFDTFLAGDYDVAAQIMSFPPENTWQDESWYRSSATFAESAAALGLPAAFVAPAPEGLPARARQHLIEHAVAPLQGLEDGFRAIAHAVRYHTRLSERRQATQDEIVLPRPAAIDCEGPAAPSARVNEAAAKAHLSEAGIAVPRFTVIDPQESGSALDVTFPVAVKALSAELGHKTEAGAVVLNVGSADEAYACARAMGERLRAAHPDTRVDGFLVEEMITDGIAELLVGIRHVRHLGQALTLALGGTAVELMDDAVTLLLPASRAQVERGLRGLKLFPLLDGWRGAPKADIGAALDATMAACRYAEAHRDQLVELEINPLLVRAAGRGAVALDAVMRQTSPGEPSQ